MKQILPILAIFIVATANSQENEVITVESTITGNQEQPNVLTIVPWKQADDFQLIEQGYDEQFDRIFPHLEPTEFERRRYFAEDLEQDSTSN